jgi:hypothetical protein
MTNQQALALIKKSMPGGTLVMAINWNSKDGLSDQPCPACHRMICKANKTKDNPAGCIEIELCDKDTHKPKDPPPCKN